MRLTETPSGIAPSAANSGPWTIVEHSWAETSVIDKGGSVVCTLSIESLATEENQGALEAIMADRARRIAAVPDMLAALKIVKVIMEGPDPRLTFGDLADVNLAINKAMGTAGAPVDK